MSYQVPSLPWQQCEFPGPVCFAFGSSCSWSDVELKQNNKHYNRGINISSFMPSDDLLF